MKSIRKDEIEYSTVTEIIENRYHELFKAVEDDDYSIEREDFDEFHEITDDGGNIIGFYTFERIGEYIISVSEIFVLKSHRGNGTAMSVILEYHSHPNRVISIRNPNERIIKTLIKNGFAFKMADNLIYSFFPLLHSTDNLIRNPRLKRLYRSSQKVEFLSCNFWDSELKSSIALSKTGEVARRKGTPMLFEPRREDFVKYRLRGKLKKVTPGFLDKEVSKIRSHLPTVDEFLIKTYIRLEESYSLDSLGIPEGLKREDVEDNFSRIALSPMRTKTRLAYLSENPDKISDEPNPSLLPERCPYCGEELEDYFVECANCGYFLDSENVPKSFKNMR